ncbi:g2263 [Coccomyxa elongata]
MELEEHELWGEADQPAPDVGEAAAGSAEELAGVPAGSSDSSSDSDYDEQLAQKMKQRGSFTGQASDPDSFLSASAAVMMTSAAASRPHAMLARQSSVVTDDSKDSTAKLGTSMPINIPALGARFGAADSEDADDRDTGPHPWALNPPHLLESQRENRMSIHGVSIGGMSPSASLKRDRLMQRNAILRRTGFIEAGAALRGTIADVLDPIKESRPLEISSGGLSRALGSSPISSITSGSPLKEKHPSALSQALGTSPSIR